MKSYQGLNGPQEHFELNEQGMRTWKLLNTLFYDKRFGAQADTISIAAAYTRNGEPIWTKWHEFFEVAQLAPKMQWLLNRANNRTILKNEIVIDLDTFNPGSIEYQNRVDKVFSILDKLKVNYVSYAPASTSWHIHIFIDELREHPMREDYKREFIGSLTGDLQKAHDRCMIALENTPHWKTGRVKQVFLNKADGINERLPA